MTNTNTYNSIFRRDDDECPDIDGESIGTYQTFRANCATDMIGNDLDRKPADNLTHCADLCSSHRPFCWGVAFDKTRRQGIQNCFFKDKQSSLSDVDDMEVALLLDSATATSDCGDIEPTYTASTGASDEYETFCGHDMPGDDMRIIPAESLSECLDKCSDLSGCKAVAYNSDRYFSFFNCFLKSSYNSDNIVDYPNREKGNGLIDLAIKVEVLNAATTSNEESSTAERTSESTPTDATISSTSNAANQASSTNPSLATESSADHGPDDTSSSVPTGAIAGGVVGGVLLLALIGLGFFLWGRRRGKKSQIINEMEATEVEPQVYKSPSTSYGAPSSGYTSSPPPQPAAIEIGSSNMQVNELPGNEVPAQRWA